MPGIKGLVVWCLFGWVCMYGHEATARAAGSLRVEG